jgi:hypothetical protein
VEIDDQVFTAIGRVVVEATNLEWTLASLVSMRQGWEGQQEASMVSTSGSVRRQLSRLVASDPEWDGVRRIEQQACSLLDERNKLVHSVVVHAFDEDYERYDVGLWHPRSGTSRSLPTVDELTQLAVGLNRCAVAAVMTHPEAEERFDRFGAACNAPPSSKAGDGQTTA